MINYRTLYCSMIMRKIENVTCEEAWVYLENVVKEGIRIAIPPTSQSSKKVGRPKWLNSHVIEKVKEKSRKYKKYRSTQDGADYLAYICTYTQPSSLGVQKGKETV